MDQVFNIRINQPLSCLFFSHEGIVYINVTLKVKTVLMFLVWVASIAVQPETKKTTVTTLQKPIYLNIFTRSKLCVTVMSWCTLLHHNSNMRSYMCI